MADQQHIISLEDGIIRANQWIQETRRVYAAETDNGNKRPKTENNDHWVTLRLNALALRLEVERLLLLMKS